jgi:peptidoglycan-N-acetylglucosamine deacetylase
LQCELIIHNRYNLEHMLRTIVTVAGACAAASFAGFHTMWPTSQLYGRNFLGLPAGSRKLALTYDDGPNDPYTLQLLEVLARHEVRATFFLVGQFVQQRPDIVRAVVAAGHDIGNHTWSHPYLIWATPAEARRQLERTSKVIEDVTGQTPALFRPPFGGRRPGTFGLVRELGMTPIMWRVSTYDWEADSPEFILDKARKGVRGGDVILMHDGGHTRMGVNRGHTVAATDRLISEYRVKGYEFVGVSEMLKEHEPTAISAQHSAVQSR